jgi:transcriptional regulator with XRE-family HTH domain
MSKTNIQLSDSSIENNPHIFRLEIGESIRLIREGRGLTQEQLAVKMNISRSTISKIESGKFNFSIDYLSKFAEFLNFEIIVK